MMIVTDNKTKIISTAAFSNGLIRRDSNIKLIHSRLIKILENLHKNSLISLLGIRSTISIHTIQEAVTHPSDIQEVERIFPYLYSLDQWKISVWKLLDLGTIKSIDMTLKLSSNTDMFLNTELKTSHSGSGELQLVWVVVLPKMPMNQPLLFVNIHQKVMLDLEMYLIHMDHMLIT